MRNRGDQEEAEVVDGPKTGRSRENADGAGPETPAALKEIPIARAISRPRNADFRYRGLLPQRARHRRNFASVMAWSSSVRNAPRAQITKIVNDEVRMVER